MAINELKQDTLELSLQSLADAVIRLREFNPIVLASAGAHPEANTSYLAMNVIRRVQLHPDGLYEVTPRGRERLPGDGLDALQRCFDETRFEVAGFTGGWVGLMCYESLQHIEPTLDVHALPYPQAEFVLVTDVLAIDDSCRLTASDLGDGNRAERLQAYHDALQIPTPLPSPPKVRGAFTTSLDKKAFESATAKLIARIHDGDLFQANVSTRFTLDAPVDPVALFLALQENPAPFMALWPGTPTVVSGSPELLFATENGVIRTRPIAGTRPRGEGQADAQFEAELLASKKERAEHTMLVDLLRNDVAKVSQAGTVAVPEYLSVERYRNVMHLVSRVEGTLRSDATVVDCIRATFPGGTITGAPKHRACMRIHEAEPVPRGPYTGSIGFVGWNHDAAFNILIRTIILHDGIHVHAGSGIVAGSKPDEEWLEANQKASSFLHAVQGRSHGSGTRLGEVTATDAWAPLGNGECGARVLLIDNYDSFTYNVAELLARYGATVKIRRNDEAFDDLLDWATHAVISPGPGWPKDAGTSIALLDSWDPAKPLLGICLGHQAMGRNVHKVDPIHGETSEIAIPGGFFAQMPNPLTVARYHSLACDAPEEYEVIATLGKMVMAMQHKTRPWIGLQFHPESIGTRDGGEIVRRFLALS